MDGIVGVSVFASAEVKLDEDLVIDEMGAGLVFEFPAVGFAELREVLFVLGRDDNWEKTSEAVDAERVALPSALLAVLLRSTGVVLSTTPTDNSYCGPGDPICPVIVVLATPADDPRC
jgi:hypothetical protein